MAVSDDEYVQDISDDDADAHRVTRGTGRGTRSARQGLRPGQQGWEVTRTWENVVEGDDGTINSTVEGLLDASKRKRTLKDTTPFQRGIIRHLILLIDLSTAMSEKDLRPTRYLLTLTYVQAFVIEYFEQNPISQLGIIGMRDGLAVRISDISGNPNDHIGSLQSLRDQEPKGDPSLQNALEMARGALFHAPTHGTREILLIFGSLLTSDPGDINQTISSLVSSHITCVVVGLAAQVAICRTLVNRTNPSLAQAEAYGVALDEQHYRSLIMRVTTPPATSRPDRGQDVDEASKATLLMMGFPSRIVEDAPSLCACHSKPVRGGYLCSRCKSKVCALPSECPACGLTLILSTHLARSYHHLWPLKNWVEVRWAWAAAQQKEQSACFGCQTRFPEVPPREKWAGKKAVVREGGVSESGRYACPNCGRFFCIDCDVFSHEVVHNCGGCLSREPALASEGPEVE